MGKPFDAELLTQQLLRLRELVHGDDDIEVKAHNRFCVRIDALSAEHALTNPLLS